MALLGDFNDDYTRTGKGFFSRMANAASFIPFLGKPLVLVLGSIDTVIESATWLFRGKFVSAATALVAGAVSTTVNSLTPGEPGQIGVALTWWGLKLGSGAATGTTLGTHARKLTEEAIGMVTGALGSKPTILRSYPAGIGSVIYAAGARAIRQ